ncbi:RtcB family protein [Mameliella alba]|nr:RtcB family protein [Mameliella alba]MBY6168564.1 RtcB family protein [Mameliella alba]MBY6174215.1 RtcB family protein [Mameliella alba]
MTDNTDFDPVTGSHLKEWGHRPGKQFPALLQKANAMRAEGFGLVRIRLELDADIPPEPQTLALRAPGELAFSENIDVTHPDEADNVAKVRETMRALMRTPTIEAGAIMPDACPAGPVGTIPVGGVAAARNAIHPGMHSADICCSVMMTDLGDADPKAVLDAAQSVTHFGPGGRRPGDRIAVSADLLEAFRANSFLDNPKSLRMAEDHMGTQGDGNHFLFVGRSRKRGRTTIVTHHGSRGPGAVLYKKGMEAAERFRRELSPETQKQNAWIPADTDEGRAYWQALQLIRDWTKANHASIHDATVATARAEPGDRFWNEHNFVFKRGDLFYHGKGATPAWGDYAADANGLTLIPLNMAQPVLVTRGKDAASGLGFSPHGAGRNYSRSEHRRRMGALTPDQLLKAETEGLDIRFHAGGVDASELPSSYKNADNVVAQIKSYDLAEIEDFIDPYGCIMAGDIPPFWVNRKKQKAR